MSHPETCVRQAASRRAAPWLCWPRTQLPRVAKDRFRREKGCASKRKPRVSQLPVPEKARRVRRALGLAHAALRVRGDRCRREQADRVLLGPWPLRRDRVARPAGERETRTHQRPWSPSRARAISLPSEHAEFISLATVFRRTSAASCSCSRASRSPQKRTRWATPRTRTRCRICLPKRRTVIAFRPPRS